MKKQNIFKHESYHYEREGSAYTLGGFLIAVVVFSMGIVVAGIVGSSELETLIKLQ